MKLSRFNTLQRQPLRILGGERSLTRASEFSSRLVLSLLFSGTDFARRAPQKEDHVSACDESDVLGLCDSFSDAGRTSSAYACMHGPLAVTLFVRHRNYHNASLMQCYSFPISRCVTMDAA